MVGWEKAGLVVPGERAEPTAAGQRCGVPNQTAPPHAPTSKAVWMRTKNSESLLPPGGEKKKADVMCTFPHSILGF